MKKEYHFFTAVSTTNGLSLRNHPSMKNPPTNPEAPIRISFWHFGQRSGSASQTFLISSRHFGDGAIGVGVGVGIENQREIDPDSDTDPDPVDPIAS